MHSLLQHGWGELLALEGGGGDESGKDWYGNGGRSI